MAGEKPRSGYLYYKGKLSELSLDKVKHLLPRDTVQIKPIGDGADVFVLDMWIQEYYYDAFGNEQTNWVYFTYTSPYYRDYVTLKADVVHTKSKTRLKYRHVSGPDRYKDFNRFYDDSLDEQLGGRRQTLG